MNPTNHQRTQTQVLISSSISALLSTLITNPIEVAKLKLQYAPTQCPYYPHSSFIELYRCNCSSFSYRDSFRGISVVLPQVFLNNISYMQLYQFQRKIYTNFLQSSQATFLAAIVSRIVVTAALVPVEALRIRISNQVQKKQLAKSQKGFKITMTRDVIYSAIFWPMAEEIRNIYTGREYRFRSEETKDDAQYLPNIIAGCIAGGLASGITTPFDALKTRIQSGVPEGTSIRNQLLQIYKKQGNLGLFSGIHFRVMKSSLHSALYLLLYEKFLRELN